MRLVGRTGQQVRFGQVGQGNQLGLGQVGGLCDVHRPPVFVQCRSVLPLILKDVANVNQAVRLEFRFEVMLLNQHVDVFERLDCPGVISGMAAQNPEVAQAGDFTFQITKLAPKLERLSQQPRCLFHMPDGEGD